MNKKRNKGGTRVRNRIPGLSTKKNDSKTDVATDDVTDPSNGAEPNLKVVEGGEDAEGSEAALDKHIAEVDRAKSEAEAKKAKAEEEAKKPKDGRIPADLADYYAVNINNANIKVINLREQLFALQKRAVALNQSLLAKDKEIYELEKASLDPQNAKLQRKHALLEGMTIINDDETGETYRVPMPK